MRLPTVAWLTCSLTRHLTLRVQQFWGWHTYLHLGLTLVEMEESALLVNLIFIDCLQNSTFLKVTIQL